MSILRTSSEIEKSTALKNIEKNQKEILEEQKVSHWKYLGLTVVAILGTNFISGLTEDKTWLEALLFFGSVAVVLLAMNIKKIYSIFKKKVEMIKKKIKGAGGASLD